MNIIFIKQVIELAITKKRFLKLDYVSKKMEITKDRVVEPLELKYKDGQPFELYCNDYSRNGDFRSLQLEGIQKIVTIKPTEVKYATTSKRVSDDTRGSEPEGGTKQA